jgi:hypothetical protein
VELVTDRRMEPATRYDGYTPRPFIDWQKWAWTLVPVFILFGLFHLAKWWVRIDPTKPHPHPSFAPRPQPTFPPPR